MYLSRSVFVTLTGGTPPILSITYGLHNVLYLSTLPVVHDTTVSRQSSELTEMWTILFDYSRREQPCCCRLYIPAHSIVKALTGL